MIKLNVKQGSEEWFEARRCVVTASEYSKVITSTGKPSKQQAGYLAALIAEMQTNNTDTFSNHWMERGIILEKDARQFYEMKNNVTVEQVGLIYKDDEKLIACSPDGLLPGRGLEIKCPAYATHKKYLKQNKLPSAYVAQVQGSMWVTGLDKWDFLSYHPDLDPLLITIDKDDDYHKLFTSIMDDFLTILVEKRSDFSI